MTRVQRSCFSVQGRSDVTAESETDRETPLINAMANNKKLTLSNRSAFVVEPTASDYESSSEYSEIFDIAEDSTFYVPSLGTVTPESPLCREYETDNDTLCEYALNMFRSAVSNGTYISVESEQEIDVENAISVVGKDETEEEETGSDALHVSGYSFVSITSVHETDIKNAIHVMKEVEDLGKVIAEPVLADTGECEKASFDKKKAMEMHRNRSDGAHASFDILQIVKCKRVQDMSPFECCALLQAGVPGIKKKAFRRFSLRRFWHNAECSRLYWTSEKRDVCEDNIHLRDITSVRCFDREFMIRRSDGYRLSIVFGNQHESCLWVRALSALVPLQTTIRAPAGILPSEKEREDYSLHHDFFADKALHDYQYVGSYTLLCPERGQKTGQGNKIAFSRTYNCFCGIRFIPSYDVQMMLRSQQEIEVLQLLSHPNLVKYYECLDETGNDGTYVVFEYVARGSLMDTSALYGAETISEMEARDIVWDVLNGLSYLHSFRIAHGDLRPEKLLCAANGSIKINALGYHVRHYEYR